MAYEARAEGVPPSVEDLAKILPEATAAHRHLSGLVHPARPDTIRRIAEEQSRQAAFRYLGPLPMVRRLVMATIVLLVAFVLFASSKSVRVSTSSVATSTTTVQTTSTDDAP